MKSQHIDRARKAKTEAAEWAALGYSEKVERCLRVVRQEVWLARRSRAWARHVYKNLP